MDNATRQPLGQLLLNRGLLSQDELRIALQEHNRQRRPIGKVLVGLGFIPEAILRQALSENLHNRQIDLAEAQIEAQAISMLSGDLARRHRLLPISYDPPNRRLRLAVADSHDLAGLDRVRASLGANIDIETWLAGESELDRAIDHHYGHTLSIDGILHELDTGEVAPRKGPVTREEHGQPVARLIDAILRDAAKENASDIHFEPEAGFLRIRYRIDGLLRQIRALHKSYWPAMSVRLKVLAGMNIAETRAPQDGRFSMDIIGRPVDFRASCQPTLHGENVVLRLLDRQKGIVRLEQLDLEQAQLTELKRMLARPEGIILVTGPTGSGKTTTLYSMLQHINHEGIHIMTLEDPVEYPMPLLRQTSVTEGGKLDFANGIRSMMRQDPDVILVGEIRDKETAIMAFRAAMTGHQVYSTLHTNSAIGAVPRLLDSGIQPDIMAGNIIGIIAQRLVRRLCEHCKVPYAAQPDEQALFTGLTGEASPALFRAGACEHCKHQGYKGRLAIMELLRIDASLDELIARRGNPHEIRQRAVQQGFRSLAENGLRRVLDGSTSLDELQRVVDLTERI